MSFDNDNDDNYDNDDNDNHNNDHNNDDSFLTLFKQNKVEVQFIDTKQ